MSTEPLEVKTTDLRRRMPDVLEHIARGGTADVRRNTRHVAVMLPPPPAGMRYELVKDDE